MTRVYISSIHRFPDSEFVEVTYAIGGEAYTIAMSRDNGDYTPETIRGLVEDKLELDHFLKAGPDTSIGTNPDEDHLLFSDEVAEAASPPRLAEALFQLFAPKKTVQHLLGDLQEVFEKNCARFGKARARRLYWAQVLRAIGPGIWRRVKKLGLIGILIDYGRSKIGW
jgi:hypothetical protein